MDLALCGLGARETSCVAAGDHTLLHDLRPDHLPRVRRQSDAAEPGQEPFDGLAKSLARECHALMAGQEVYGGIGGETRHDSIAVPRVEGRTEALECWAWIVHVITA